MSSPRRGGDDGRTSARAGFGDNDGSRARGASPGHGQGAGDLSFGSTPAPYWFAFAPPHPWAAFDERAHAPVFVAQPPNDPFPWNMPPVLSGRPFGGGPAAPPLMPPWGPPPREVPFVGFVGGGTGAPSKGYTGEPGVFPVGGGGGDRSVPVVAPCLPLVRRVGQRAAARKSNFLASPLSFHAALALVAAGARGDTQRELLGFLGSESLHELHRAPATSLLGTLCGLPQTSFACGVWVDSRQALVPEFMDTAASRYAAVAEAVDFVAEPEAARHRINAFVGEATKGFITDVLPPRSVDSSTVLVLANALYFKGAWARPFDPWMTSAAPFHVPGCGTVRAPFMTTIQFKEQLVAVFPGFKALKLPYKNDGGAREAALFYMLLLLPDGDAEALEIGDLYDRAVSTPGFIGKHTPVEEVPVGRFMVPKFKFTFEFEASKDMRDLGVAIAFGGGDFSGMVTGGDGLFISGVYPKATIEVDELGTVAAAATAVVIAQCGRVGPPPVDFVADRPFLFAIVEERSGVVLFLGHVVDPLAE